MLRLSFYRGEGWIFSQVDIVLVCMINFLKKQSVWMNRLTGVEPEATLTLTVIIMFWTIK